MEPNENTYNGWTNYETWVTALWLDNDQASYAYWRAVACECRRDAGRTNQAVTGLWPEEQAARYLLADQLKAEIAVLDDALRAYEDDIAKLQNRLREARSRQSAIAARLESAENRVKLRSLMSTESSASL